MPTITVTFPDPPPLTPELAAEHAKLSARWTELDNLITPLEEERSQNEQRMAEISQVQTMLYSQALARSDSEREPWRRIMVYHGNHNEANLASSVGRYPFELFDGMTEYGFDNRPAVQTHTWGTKCFNFWNPVTGKNLHSPHLSHSLHPGDLARALKESGVEGIKVQPLTQEQEMQKYSSTLPNPFSTVAARMVDSSYVVPKTVDLYKKD